MSFSQLRYALTAVLLSLLVFACRGVDRDDADGSTGELTLGITDGPVEKAQDVRLVLDGIEIIPEIGDPILVEDLREDTIDLLELQGGEREEVLRRFDLPDGRYESIRLIVNQIDSFIRDENGEVFPLTIPAGEEDNLILEIGIALDEDNDLEDFTIDVDLRRSIRVDNSVSPPEYFFRPRLRIVETSRSATLRGTVDRELIEDTSCANENSNEDGNAIYLYRENVVGEQDIQDDDEKDPFATATVKFNDDSDEWEFAFGFLPIASYKAVFTCNAILDDPDDDDEAEMEFSAPLTVNVQRGNTETLRFE